MIDPKILLIVYAVYLALLSFVTFCLYGADKRKAKKGKWRTPEKVLLLCSFLGGAYGGFLAMQLFRHKTTAEHWYFTAVNVLGLLLHTAAIVCIVVFLIL